MRINYNFQFVRDELTIFLHREKIEIVPLGHSLRDLDLIASPMKLVRRTRNSFNLNVAGKCKPILTDCHTSNIITRC